jgi:ABC-2 type transport system ATP-binding protein
MLQAIDLTKRYEDGHVALDRLTLEVKPEQIYCLLGANGAGKTTTINLFLGFIPATAGSARIAGVDVSRDPLTARRRAAYLPENVMLYGAFTARQNLQFFARLSGRSDFTRDALYAAMRDAGIPENAFERRVAAFSKGMRQKLGLAIAIARQADVLLLDEPTSGLDPQATAEFKAVLYKLRSDGKAVFMSTHDIFRSREIADRVGIMRAGRLVAELGRDEFLREDLERLYLNYMGDERGVERQVPCA